MSRYTLAMLDTELADESSARAGTPAGTVHAGADAILLERFQHGDNGALVELFDRHNRRLSTYCQKLLGSREQASDVAQEMWERVLRLRNNPRKVDNPVGFFLRIARNLCLNHIKARRNHAPLGSLPEGSHPIDPAGRYSEMEERILCALDSLSFEHREVLVLNIYCGYRMEEIAAMIGKSPEAVWKRASRARKELRALVMNAEA